MSNGLKIQWGTFSGDKRTSTSYFTLPISFSNTNYFIVSGLKTNERYGFPIAYPLGNQSFNGDSNYGYSAKGEAYYVAIGY